MLVEGRKQALAVRSVLVVRIAGGSDMNTHFYLEVILVYIWRVTSPGTQAGNDP
jgi:hypothetical protein